MGHCIAIEQVAQLSGKPLMRAILEAVAKEHGLLPRDLMDRDRRPHVALARQDAYHRIYATNRFSYPTIGRFFGRDHTTVLYGVKAYRRALADRVAA